jgi:hypothetical protein
VPKVVTAALQAKAPHYRIIEAYSIAREGRIVSYAFEGQVADGP